MVLFCDAFSIGIFTKEFLLAIAARILGPLVICNSSEILNHKILVPYSLGPGRLMVVLAV